MTSRVFTVFLGFALCTSLLVAKIANADETAALATSKIANANDQTRVFLKTKMAEMKIPAMQVAVVVKGRVVMSEAYGTTNIEQQILADRKTLFPINSATKSFTGVAIMQLVEAWLVDLEAPVSRYLADLPESWREIRIRQLLAHTSGLPDIVDQNGLIGGGNEAKAWDVVRSLPMESVPGTGFSYNQTNYVLLARIIDKLSGRPFAAFFVARQFKPAGMTRARFGDGYDIVPGRASVYIHGQAERSDRKTDPAKLYHWIDEIPESTRAGAGLYTTADELAQWIIALENGRLLAKKSSVDRLWAADKLNDGKSNIWAMGWPILAGTSRRAVGGIGGGRSAFFVYPDDNVAVIVMTNMVGANPQTMIDTVADNYISSTHH